MLRGLQPEDTATSAGSLSFALTAVPRLLPALPLGPSQCVGCRTFWNMCQAGSALSPPLVGAWDSHSRVILQHTTECWNVSQCL